MSSFVITDRIDAKTIFTPEQRKEIRNIFKSHIKDTLKSEIRAFQEIEKILENWRLNVAVKMIETRFICEIDCSDNLLPSNEAFQIFNRIINHMPSDYVPKSSQRYHKMNVRFVKILQNVFLDHFQLKLLENKLDSDANYCPHVILGDILRNEGSKFDFTVSWSPANPLYCQVNKTVAQLWSSEEDETDEIEIVASSSC